MERTRRSPVLPCGNRSILEQFITVRNRQSLRVRSSAALIILNLQGRKVTPRAPEPAHRTMELCPQNPETDERIVVLVVPVSETDERATI